MNILENCYRREAIGSQWGEREGEAIENGEKRSLHGLACVFELINRKKFMCERERERCLL